MGDTFGKISHVDFAFDRHHALITTETNIQATVLTVDSRNYIELKTPKFSSASSFAFHPKGRHIALLSRSDGKDVITTYKIGDSSWNIEATFTLPTVDAQSMIWSADGRFLAVCESASMGCKIYFFAADGQRLDNMDILNIGLETTAEDFEGLGVKSMVWFSSSNIFTVTDFAGNIVLRRLTESYRVSNKNLSILELTDIT